MVALNPPVCDFGRPAPDFTLPGTDGRTHRLADLRGKVLGSFEYGYERTLVVDRSAAPDRIVADDAAEWIDSPGTARVVGHGHDVLVREQGHRLGRPGPGCGSRGQRTGSGSPDFIAARSETAARAGRLSVHEG